MGTGSREENASKQKIAIRTEYYLTESVALGRDPFERVLDRACQRFQLKGLFKRWPIAEFFWQSLRAVAGRKHERPVTHLNRLGNG